MVSGPYGMESTCEPNKEKKLSEQIRAAMGNIEGTLDTKAVVQNVEMGLEAPKAPESLRNSSYFLSDVNRISLKAAFLSRLHSRSQRRRKVLLL